MDLQRGSNGTGSRTEARPRGFARLSGVLALLLALSGSIAVADPPSGSDRPIIGDDWVLGIGAFIAEFKIDAAVGVGSVVSTTVRFEDQLGIDRERSIFRLEGFHRFSERHAVEFGFWTAERQGDAVLDSQIEFDGNLFDVDARVNSWVDTSWFRLGWRYSMVGSDRGEAGIEFGLSIYDTALGIDGEATVVDPDGTTSLEAVRTDESVLAPVPTFGIFLNQSLRPNLTLLVSADFMDVTFGELELDLTDVTAMLVWNFSSHVGVGLGLNKSNGEFRDSGSSPYSIGFSRTGLLGYMALRF